MGVGGGEWAAWTEAGSIRREKGEGGRKRYRAVQTCSLLAHLNKALTANPTTSLASPALASSPSHSNYPLASSPTPSPGAFPRSPVAPAT